MYDMILHPVAATPIPRTIIAMGKSGKTIRKPASRDLTADQLRELLAARGIEHKSAHTKAELRAMHTSGVYVRPAAYDRQNKARAAKRAAAKATKI